MLEVRTVRYLNAQVFCSVQYVFSDQISILALGLFSTCK